MALPPDSPLFPEATPEERLWPRYFLEDRFNSDDVRMPFILALAEHFAGPRKTSIRSQIERSGVFYLDLVGFDEEAPVENFTDLLRSEPTNVISCLELAIHLMLLRDGLEVQAKVIIRLLNFGPCQQLQKLIRSSNVEKFVSLQGTVVRMSSIQPLVVAMRFVCSACDSDAEITFPDGKYEPPCGCVNSSCKSRNMQPDRSSAVTIDYQKIRLQELFSDIGAEAGRVPRSIEIELKQDLVDSCLPGDVITVSGIVKALKAEQRSSGSRQETCLYILYVVANSVVNTKRGTSSAEPKEGFAENGLKDSESVSNSSSSFTLQELHAIRTIHASPYLFELIVNSLCPGIFGHELVKAGLCLGLFSGGDWSTGDPNRNSMRRDIHVLLLGDPGMGKSQLLRACSVVSPRAVYVCGNSTTTAGLTVAIVKDSNGDSALEAGALVLADKGICCIDEFDKMSSDPQALLEAMEQQSISIAKAGICCSLSARASVFVAANPVGGHYNRTKTILENMKISPALLSRFDLVFVLVDDPDACRDELLSEHVLALHSNSGLGTQRSSSSQSSKFATPRRASVLGHVPTQVQSEDANLASRIKYVARSCSSFEPIPPPLLRKYIAYSKEFVRPKLSKDAKIVLKSFYLSLRRQHNSPDNCSITIRQLESLVRLSEARARMELRELVTEQDALDTVDVMKSSLFDLFSDDFQPVDPEADAKPYGPKRVDAFIKALKRAAREMEREPPLFNHKELISIAKASNVVVPNFDLFIQQMNQNNFILFKGGGMYQIL